MRTIERDIVAALLFSKDGKLLQARQAENKHRFYPGHWGIPGGGVEAGEERRTALNREFLEETGLDISKYEAELIDEAQGEGEKTLKDTDERVHCKMKFYTYKVIIDDRNADEIAVQLDDEHTEYCWSDISELKDMKLTPPSVALFKRLGYL